MFDVPAQGVQEDHCAEFQFERKRLQMIDGALPVQMGVDDGPAVPTGPVPVLALDRVQIPTHARQGSPARTQVRSARHAQVEYGTFASFRPLVRRAGAVDQVEPTGAGFVVDFSAARMSFASRSASTSASLASTRLAALIVAAI